MTSSASSRLPSKARITWGVQAELDNHVVTFLMTLDWIRKLATAPGVDVPDLSAPLLDKPLRPLHRGSELLVGHLRANYHHQLVFAH